MRALFKADLLLHFALRRHERVVVVLLLRDALGKAPLTRVNILHNEHCAERISEDHSSAAVPRLLDQRPLLLFKRLRGCHLNPCSELRGQGEVS